MKALEYKGRNNYLLNKEQGISKTTGNKYTIYKLYEYMDIEEYKIRFPEDDRDLSKYEHMKVELYSCFKPIDMLLQLVEIYKSVSREVRR